MRPGLLFNPGVGGALFFAQWIADYVIDAGAPGVHAKMKRICAPLFKPPGATP